MIKKLDIPVTYDALKDAHFIEPPFIAGSLSIFIAAFIVVFYIALLLLIMEATYTSIIKRIIYIIILIATIIPVSITCYKLFNHSLIKYYLDQNPYYRNVNISGSINDISNGSNSDNQELRFDYNGKNYYVTIPSDIPAQSNDKVNVKINKQLVFDELNLNNLNKDLSREKNNVTINHHDKTYHTHLIGRGYDNDDD